MVNTIIYLQKFEIKSYASFKLIFFIIINNNLDLFNIIISKSQVYSNSNIKKIVLREIIKK